MNQDSETIRKPVSTFKENTHESLKNIFNQILLRLDSSRRYIELKNDKINVK